MLFTSPEFVVFFLIAWAVYFLPALRSQQIPWLLAASLFFYGWEIPRYLALIVASILLNATVSYLLLSADKRRRLLVLSGVAANLAILLWFKYGRLLAESVARLTGLPPLPYFEHIELPLGISFYTFQGISLVVDASRPEAQASYSRDFKTHFVRTALFISFFPHQIAGPIVRAHQLYPQFGPKTLADIRWEDAFRALIQGCFLKMVIADNLKDYTFWLDYPYFQHFSTLTLLSMLLGYSMQIFADFAGYSLMAIGLARLFGYELCQNFNYPYIAASLREFWTRWHMSLSGWLREYLYFPLGGNRGSAFRTGLNLLIVMTLGGLWHGAAWGFAIWGFYHGALLMIERWGGQLGVPSLPRALAIPLVFVLVSIGWSLFRLTDYEHLVTFCVSLIQNWSMAAEAPIVAGNLLYSIPIFLMHAYALRQKDLLSDRPWIRPALYGSALFLIVTASGLSTRFIYFQF